MASRPTVPDRPLGCNASWDSFRTVRCHRYLKRNYDSKSRSGSRGGSGPTTKGQVRHSFVLPKSRLSRRPPPGSICPHSRASWRWPAASPLRPIQSPFSRVTAGLQGRGDPWPRRGSGFGTPHPDRRAPLSAPHVPRARGRASLQSLPPDPTRPDPMGPAPRPFTRRASRAAARSVVAGCPAGRERRRLSRAPQEGRHELRGVDVGHEGLGVDVELPAEGRAQVLPLGLGCRRQGAATTAGARPGGLHVRLVPAVGRRVAAAATAAAAAAAAATTTAGIHDRGGRVCGEERAGNGGGGVPPGRSRPR
jgi:hypothetical protein